jgi:hypothetical protein
VGTVTELRRRKAKKSGEQQRLLAPLLVEDDEKEKKSSLAPCLSLSLSRLFPKAITSRRRSQERDAPGFATEESEETRKTGEEKASRGSEELKRKVEM